MAVQRLLLLQRPAFRLRSSSLIEPGRWHYSSSAKQEPKDKGRHDEANVSKSAVQNKVGQSWKTLSGLLTKMKEAFVSPLMGNQHGVEKFDSKVEPGETESKANSSRTIMDLQSHMEAVSSSVIDNKSETEDYSKLKSQVQQPSVAESDADTEEIKAKLSGEDVIISFQQDEVVGRSTNMDLSTSVARDEGLEAGELYGVRTDSKISVKLNSKSKSDSMAKKKKSKSDSKSETNGVSACASDVDGSKLIKPPATSKNGGKFSKKEMLRKRIDNAEQSVEKSNGHPHGILFGMKDEVLVESRKRNVLSLIGSMSTVPIPREHPLLGSPTAIFGAKKKLKVASSESQSISGVDTLRAETNVGLSPAVNSNSRVDSLLSQTSEGTKDVCFSDDVQGKATLPTSVSCPEVLIPNVIGDPDVPVALVKHPTRTIKIANLTCELKLDQLEEALEIGAGSVSLIILGPTSSVAYAEFKTEEAKEGAIAKHSINIEGNNLKMYRIDSPKTTVVRICIDKDKKLPTTLLGLCKEHGKVRNIFHRAPDVADVHFELDEWPNMLNILNSLNGMEVKEFGVRMVAFPAPVYPQDVIELLWKQSDGRKHVKSVVRSLLQRINSPAKSAEKLMNKAYEYYVE